MSTFGSWCMLVQAVNYLEVTEGITWGVKTIKNYGMQWKPRKKTDGSEWGCGFYWVLSLKRWDNGSQHMLRQRPFNTWKSYTDLHLAESKSCVWRCSSLSLWFFQVITRTHLGQTVENAWKKKKEKNRWMKISGFKILFKECHVHTWIEKDLSLKPQRKFLEQRPTHRRSSSGLICTLKETLSDLLMGIIL